MIKIKIPIVINISATLKVNQWKLLKCKSIKSGTALYTNLSKKFPRAPPIIIEYMNLSVFSDWTKINSKNIITIPTVKVTKLYNKDESVLKKPKPIPMFQIKSKLM